MILWMKSTSGKYEIDMDDVCRTAIQTYGEVDRLVKLARSMKLLAQAILSAVGLETDREEIADKIAELLILLRQAEMVFDIRDTVQKKTEEKLEDQYYRMKEEWHQREVRSAGGGRLQ